MDKTIKYKVLWISCNEKKKKKQWFSSSQQANHLGGGGSTDFRQNRNGQNAINAICYFPGESKMDQNSCQVIRY